MEYYKNLDLADIIYFDEEGNQKTEQWKDVIGIMINIRNKNIFKFVSFY